MPTVGATLMLDRLGPKRSDAGFLKSKQEAPGARYLILADLKPVIRSNPERTTARLAWFSGDELAQFGLPTSDALFLGVDKADNGHFAVAVTEHRTRHVPGAIEKLRPIVDLEIARHAGHHVARGAVAVRPGAGAGAVARERQAAAATAAAPRSSRTAAGGASAGRAGSNGSRAPIRWSSCW